jgi:hypothetical protein
VGVLAPGLQPGFVLFDPNPADAPPPAADTWLKITPEIGLADHPCEIRVGPPTP